MGIYQKSSKYHESKNCRNLELFQVFHDQISDSLAMKYFKKIIRIRPIQKMMNFNIITRIERTNHSFESNGLFQQSANLVGSELILNLGIFTVI
jgi:hypothetical protein